MAQESGMTKNLNQKTTGKELVVCQPKRIKRAFRRGDYLRPVSFITRAEVYRLADAAKTMRDGEK